MLVNSQLFLHAENKIRNSQVLWYQLFDWSEQEKFPRQCNEILLECSSLLAMTLHRTWMFAYLREGVLDWSCMLSDSSWLCPLLNREMATVAKIRVGLIKFSSVLVSHYMDNWDVAVFVLNWKIKLLLQMLPLINKMSPQRFLFFVLIF